MAARVFQNAVRTSLRARGALKRAPTSCVRFVSNPSDNSAYAADPKTKTHTGISWADEDYRNVRFVNRDKEVNAQVAQELIDEIPPTVVHGRRVACDGGGGALGHPKVFINLDQGEVMSCPYCGLRFVQAAH